MQAGRGSVKRELMLLREALLFRSEKVMMSLDLKLEMTMERKMSRPMISRIWCFLCSLTEDPSKKNRAMEAKIAATMTMGKLRPIILLLTYKVQIQMNVGIEDKIKKYRDAKNIKNNFDSAVEDKRKKLQQLIESNYGEGENDIPNQAANNTAAIVSRKVDKSGDSFMDFKHRRYIQITKQLMEAKSKMTEVTHQMEDLKTEVYFEEKKLAEMRDYLSRQYVEQEEMISKKQKKLEQEKADKVKMYEQRMAKNIEHIQQLLKQKEEQNERKLKFIEKKKKFEESKKKFKEKYEEELRISKERWAEEERAKKEAWQKSKFEQIEGRTLRNLEPEIQRIVMRSKDEVNKIREKFEQQMEEFKKAADEEYEKSVKTYKQSQSQKLEQERALIVQENSRKLRQQTELLERQFEEERIKAKNDYNEEIKQLEQKRRTESEDYFRKNRYFHAENLQELRRIKDEYETKIKQLDGVLMKQVEDKEKSLAQRNRIKIDQLKQVSRLKLKKRMEEYDKKIKAQIQNSIEQLSSEIAIQSATYQTRIAKATEQRIKDQKQLAQSQIKQIKKSILALQSKIQAAKKERQASKQQRASKEEQYLQTKSENQYLNRKLLEAQKQLQELKVSESSIEGRKSERREEVEQMWDRQISSITETLSAVEQQIKTVVDLMAQKQKMLLKQTSEAVQEIEKHSDKIIKQKQMQQEGLLVKIEHEEKQRESLRVLLRNQQQLAKNYGKK